MSTEETTGLVDPNASETLAATAPADPLDTPELNQAAFEFNQVIPKIKTTVRSMSLRQLQRVLTAAAEFPLGKNYPKFISKKENELFMLLLHADGLKGIMKYVVMQNAATLQEIQEQAIDNTVSELKEQAIKESSDV